MALRQLGRASVTKGLQATFPRVVLEAPDSSGKARCCTKGKKGSLATFSYKMEYNCGRDYNSLSTRVTLQSRSWAGEQIAQFYSIPGAFPLNHLDDCVLLNLLWEALLSYICKPNTLKGNHAVRC